ncbi:hypothetical protein [Helicobacter sp. UBA3407]|nr:hypothetical protein [Helicobacter sp. UBA3407]
MLTAQGDLNILSVGDEEVVSIRNAKLQIKIAQNTESFEMFV